MTDSHGSTPGSPPNQSLRRPLTSAERRLADALEAIFATGEHDFARVVVALQQQGVARPSGSTEPWSISSLETELEGINDSLDTAYSGARADTDH